MKVQKLRNTATIPTKAHLGDLGYDVYADTQVTLQPGVQRLIPTGIAVKLPEGWGGLIKDRSSMAMRGLIVHAGVIDEGYRGEIKVLLRNVTMQTIVLQRGDKIAQLVPIRTTEFYIKEVDDLDETERGARGFGSTGD